MSLWERKIGEDSLMQLVGSLGLKGTAAELGVDEREILRRIQMLRYRWDAETFSVETLKIINKNGDLVPLNLNNGQKKILSAIEAQKLAGKPVRIALLKARQFGGSTLFEEEIFRESILRPNRSSMIVAHDLDSARHLREMSARYYENYQLQKPKIKKESEKWWKFIHFVNNLSAASHVRIDTAEELSVGHSLTLHNLHLSEIQNWRNAPVLVKGLFPTVPKTPDTMIFMEGTGSGVGDYWYDFCQMAQTGESGWTFVFVPWYEIEDYTARFDNPDQRASFEAKLDDEEKLLYHKGVSLEQLYWRRSEINGTYKGDIDAFRQQYPSDPDEAFMTSGRPVFNPLIVKKRIAECRKPAFVGDLTEKGGEVVFEENSRGIWEIDEKPEKLSNLYVCGVDCSEGIAVVPELGNKGGDYGAIKVLRRDSNRVVGKLMQRLDPEILAEEVFKGWKFWGYGILIESNAGGSGNVVIRALRQIPGIPLLSRVSLGGRVDEVKANDLGWKTMKDTKRVMIDELMAEIHGNTFFDYDKDFWYQCSTYVRDEKGRTNAQSRKYDDLVMAMALAFQGDKLMPKVFRPTKEEPKVITPDMDIPQNYKRRFTSTQAQVMAETYCEF